MYWAGRSYRILYKVRGAGLTESRGVCIGPIGWVEIKVKDMYNNPGGKSLLQEDAGVVTAACGCVRGK